MLRKILIEWGDYMVSSLPDPGNQLCTDDFEGPSPYNVNLAAKVYYSYEFIFVHSYHMCIPIFSGDCRFVCVSIYLEDWWASFSCKCLWSVKQSLCKLLDVKGIGTLLRIIKLRYSYVIPPRGHMSKQFQCMVIPVPLTTTSENWYSHAHFFGKYFPGCNVQLRHIIVTCN